MFLVRFFDQQNEPNEPYVFHFKRIVDGKETVLAEREKERLRLYLAGAYEREELRSCHQEQNHDSL